MNGYSEDGIWYRIYKICDFLDISNISEQTYKYLKSITINKYRIKLEKEYGFL